MSLSTWNLSNDTEKNNAAIRFQHTIEANCAKRIQILMDPMSVDDFGDLIHGLRYLKYSFEHKTHIYAYLDKHPSADDIAYSNVAPDAVTAFSGKILAHIASIRRIYNSGIYWNIGPEQRIPFEEALDDVWNQAVQYHKNQGRTLCCSTKD